MKKPYQKIFISRNSQIHANLPSEARRYLFLKYFRTRFRISHKQKHPLRGVFVLIKNYYFRFLDAETFCQMAFRKPDVYFIIMFLGHPVFNGKDFIAEKRGNSNFGAKSQEIGGDNAVADPGVGSGNKRRAISLVRRG